MRRRAAELGRRGPLRAARLRAVRAGAARALPRSAHAFVHVSLTEGVPQVLVEALASRNAHRRDRRRRGTRRRSRTARAGLLVPPADLGALVERDPPARRRRRPSRSLLAARPRARRATDARGGSCPRRRVPAIADRQTNPALLTLEGMCGICGLVLAERRPVDRGLLDEMNETLLHRGPDSGGIHVEGGTGLAARRLAIIDLADRRPAAHERGRLGRRRPERRDLQLPRAARRARSARATRSARRATPRCSRISTRSTGPRFAEHLRGMFAVAVWDAKRRRLVLARDRFGIKPLYYRRHRRVALVRVRAQGAPAPAGLLARDRPRRGRGLPRVQLRPRAALDLPRGAEAAAGQRARLGGRRRLARCGSSATRARGRPRPAALREESEEELAEELLERLRDSVRAHLIADVPVGVLLSGGIDSCTLAALASESVRHVQHVHDRLRRARLRRAQPRAPRRRALRHRPPRARAQPGRGRAAARAGRGLRRAVRGLVGDPDLPRLAARAPARQGRALRRGRRRALRRLQLLRGPRARARGSRPPPRSCARSSSGCRPRPARRAASTGRRSASSAPRSSADARAPLRLEVGLPARGARRRSSCPSGAPRLDPLELLRPHYARDRAARRSSRA